MQDAEEKKHKGKSKRAMKMVRSLACTVLLLVDVVICYLYWLHVEVCFQFPLRIYNTLQNIPDFITYCSCMYFDLKLRNVFRAIQWRKLKRLQKSKFQILIAGNY